MKKYSQRFVKYLIEITIIIIGVIIAFYLTEYGERLSRNQNEKDVVNQIYFELQDNLEDLERDFVVHRTGLGGHLNAIRFLDGKIEMSDSLIMDFYWLTRDEYIYANRTGYENLKNFGINLIKDDSLRNLITLVYNHDFPRLTKGSTIHPDISEYMTPFFEKNFAANRDTSLKHTMVFNDSLSITYPRLIGLGVYQCIGYIPLDPADLKQNESFRFLLSTALEYRIYKVVFYRTCIENVKQALRRIEEHYAIQRL